MAAQRAGVTKVFIPKSNEADLKDVAKEVLDRIEVVPVSDVQELLNAVLLASIKSLPAKQAKLYEVISDCENVWLCSNLYCRVLQIPDHPKALCRAKQHTLLGKQIGCRPDIHYNGIQRQYDGQIL